MESRFSVLLADLRQAFPRFSVTNLKFLLVLLFVFLLGLSFFVALSHLIPPVDFQRYGYPGVFLVNLLPSLSIVVPAHVAMPSQAFNVVVAASGSVLWVALLASLGSTLGELTAYYAGYGGKRIFNLGEGERYKTADKWMKRHGALAITLFAFLPLFFFDLVAIAAGGLRFPVRRFLLFSFLGRFPRAFAEIYLYTWVFEHIISSLPAWVNTPFVS